LVEVAVARDGRVEAMGELVPTTMPGMGGVPHGFPLGLRRGAVSLEESQPWWRQAYEHLACLVRAALPDVETVVEHVGSTAVPGLPAKPIIDIAVQIPRDVPVHTVIAQLEAHRFMFRGDQGSEGGLLFVRDAGPERRVCHVHVVREGDPQWDRYLSFRDRLRADGATRDAYAHLKTRLAGQHPDDRQAYTTGKSAFIRKVLDNEDTPPPAVDE
jgi:GrpB-like predicted nucleotidyltransferase (UPF0157 family)